MTTTTREAELAEFEKNLKRFEKHKISRRGDGRYLLQEPTSDGGWTWIMAAEIHCSFSRSTILVCGDIDTIAFGHFSDDRKASLEVRERKLLNWMGKCRDIEYYVAQKATIGMDGGRSGDALVWDFDRELAEKEIRSWIADREKWLRWQGDGDIEHGLEDDDTCAALKRILDEGIDDRDSVLRELWDTCDHDFLYSHMEGDGFGMVLSWRVKIAHAAIAKLCQLLDAEDAAAVGAAAGAAP